MGILLVNILFSSLSIPLILGVVVVILSFTISLYRLMWMKSSWFIVVFVLVFIGGILIIFIYIASLAHNEVLTWNVGAITIILPITTFLSLGGVWRRVVDRAPFDFAEAEWFFRWRYCGLTLFFIRYLLVVFIVVDLVGVFGGCVRKMYVNELF